MEQKLTEAELQNIQTIIRDVNTVKANIGSLEVQKAQMINRALMLEGKLANFETEISSKYGEGCTINMSTGEIKQPQPIMRKVE